MSPNLAKLEKFVVAKEPEPVSVEVAEPVPVPDAGELALRSARAVVSEERYVNFNSRIERIFFNF